MSLRITKGCCLVVEISNLSLLGVEIKDVVFTLLLRCCYRMSGGSSPAGGQYSLSPAAVAHQQHIAVLAAAAAHAAQSSNQDPASGNAAATAAIGQLQPAVNSNTVSAQPSNGATGVGGQ